MTLIPPKLAHLARLYGIQTSYKDMRRQRRDASPESLIAALQALGSPMATAASLDSVLLERRQQLWNRVIEPVVVAWDGKIPPLLVRTREESAASILRYELRQESGESFESSTRVSKLQPRNRQEIGGVGYVERDLVISKPVASGYHRLTVEVDGREYDSLLIAAPMKAYMPFERKEWGVFSPVYSLHSKRNPNAGDLTDFETLTDWAGVLGGRVVGTLPLLAAFLDDPCEFSPYSPASRLFWNEFYTDVGQYRRPSKSDLIDYRKEMQFRRGVLEKDAAAFFRRKTTERARFDRFVSTQPELERYARFRAASERHGSWRNWPETLRESEIDSQAYAVEAQRYHLYAQWRIQDQLAGLSDKTRRNGQLLYLDLPLGLHPDSYDLWRYRDLFVNGADGGAPPDPVFTQGQNWGFPPMHPEAMRLRHHDYTIAYIRNHLRFARMLRIDHVMGLHRLFWIPKGLSGDKGVYVEYPAEEVYAILSLESHRHQAAIVGENLGTVPPEVNTAMERHNIQQMYVLQYETVGSDPKRALRPVPQNAVASLNTHDMAPFRAFLDGLDIDDRVDLQFLAKRQAGRERQDRAAIRKALCAFLQQKGLLRQGLRVTPEEILKAALEFLSGSMARVVLINLEDLWQEVLPQNVPATQHERPNWRRKARLSLEQMAALNEGAELLRTVDRKRRSRR